jgi:hypothetical protein
MTRGFLFGENKIRQKTCFFTAFMLYCINKFKKKFMPEQSTDKLFKPIFCYKTASVNLIKAFIMVKIKNKGAKTGPVRN